MAHVEKLLPKLNQRAEWISSSLGRIITAISFSADVKYLATGDDEGLLVIYEAVNWTVVFEAGSAGDYPITYLAWNPRKEYSRRLVIGYRNGDLIRIRVSAGSSASEAKADRVNGCINTLTFNREGRQLAVSFGDRVFLYDTTQFDAEELDRKAVFALPTIDGVVPVICSTHFLPEERIIIACMHAQSGIITFSSKAPYEMLGRFGMRDLEQQVLMGHSALSPTGRILAVTNFIDGVDWFDTERQTYLSTTSYNLGECIPVGIKFLSNDTVAVGHSRGHLVVAAFHEVANSPASRISFDHPPNPRTSTQVMDIGIRQSNPLIATAHTTRIERERSDQDLQSDVLISTVTGWIEGERDAARPRANEPAHLQVSVTAKCVAIAAVALAFYLHNFGCAVPGLTQSSVALAMNPTVTEIVTVKATRTISETLTMASTAIETSD